MANSTTGVLGLCSCCPDSTVTTTVNVIALITFVLGVLVALVALAGAVRGARPEVQRTAMELQQITENMHRIKRVFERDLGSHTSTGTHIPEEIMTEYRRVVGMQIESFEKEFHEVLPQVIKVENLFAHRKRRSFSSSSPKLSPLRKTSLKLIWALSRDAIAPKMARLREQSAKLSALHASYVAEKNGTTLERISYMMEELLKPSEQQETRLNTNLEKLNLLREQQEALLRIFGEARGIPIDEILRDRSAHVFRNENDAGTAPQETPPVFKESPVSTSADIPTAATDEALEASPEEEPPQKDSPENSPGEGRPAAEESAPEPADVVPKTTENTSGI